MRLPNLFSKKENFVLCIRVYTFAYMMEEKEDKGVISVRPPENSDMKERLSKYADDTERSMNYHAVKAIEEYLSKYYPIKKLQKDKK
ncbi:MAG TPA: hypothetical protein PKV73_01245 [Agriterribacter sp.]|nr:hypothetical protein [Agriterribacter sp.]